MYPRISGESVFRWNVTFAERWRNNYDLTRWKLTMRSMGHHLMVLA